LSDVLALGGRSTCVRDHNVARCWGENNFGQLGNNINVGTVAPNSTPTLVASIDLGIVRQVAVGRAFSCALRDDGRLLCWGENGSGQLGNNTNVGTGASNPAPTLVDNTNLGVVRQLTLGSEHICALRDDGRVFCWGENDFGQLGNNTNVGTEEPNPAPTLVDNTNLGVVRQLALGRRHACALRDDGRVLCWGLNDSGQLGTNTNVGTDAPNPTPTLVDSTDLGVVRQLALGDQHTCALRDDGRVLCWGLNDSGQLGHNTNVGTSASNPTPTLVASTDLGVVRQLALGDDHTCALRDDGRVLCWGLNDFGQLGNNTNLGTVAPNVTPTLVDSTDLGVVRQLALGVFHTCVLRDDGRVLCWGLNASGQLGTNTNVGTNNPNPAPLLVEGLPLLLP
jgi:alpha-tubulin suppressor-like RCC1 family protein